MPHIIYIGTADLIAVHRDFQPITRSEEGWIIKLLKAYLANDSRSVLFESTAVRSGFSVNFYVLAEQKKESVTVRVDARTNVEKNDGVKRAVAIAGELVARANPALKYDKTNLPPFIFNPPTQQS